VKQLVDDMLDFTASESAFGKPSNGADLKLGLATAPTLYAWEQHPALGPLIARNFAEDGDVEQARELISRSDGTRRTYELASKHVELARTQLDRLPESEAREALRRLTDQVLRRTK
jgi:hexaprenyl-diphosphate synthase